LPRAPDHLLEASSERGIFLRERHKFVEHWINNQRHEENHQHQNRNRQQPEIKPPVAGAAADHSEENPDQEGADNNCDHLQFGPVPEPRWPCLDAEAKFQAHEMAGDCDRRQENVEREDEQRCENRGLNKMCGGGILSPVAIFSGEPPFQDETKCDERVENGEELEPESDLAESMGFPVQVWGQRIGRDFSLGRLRGGLSSLNGKRTQN
jgi:hypothetical protein